MNKNERLKEIDILKGLTIFLVVLGHSGFNADSGIISNMLRDFRMPLFFIVSGHLFSTTKYLDNMNKLVMDKFRTLIIPYISFGIVGAIIWYFKSTNNNEVIEWTKPIFGLFRGSILNNPPVWFLIVLFFSFVIFKIILSLTKNYSFIIKLSSFIVIGILGYIFSKTLLLPMKIDVAMVAVLFMFIGNLLKEKQVLSKNRAMVTLTIISLPLFLYASTFNIPGDMNLRTYGNLSLFYIAGISGSMLALFLTKYILTRSRLMYIIFTSLGKESIIILGFHFSVGIYFTRYIEQTVNLNFNIILTTIMAIIIPLSLSLIIRRSPILSLLFKGKPLKRKRIRYEKDLAA